MNKKIKILRYIISALMMYLINCSRKFIKNNEIGVVFNIICIIIMIIVWPKEHILQELNGSKDFIDKKIKIVFTLICGIIIGVLLTIIIFLN